MRFILGFLLVLSCSSRAMAQTESDDELLSPRILALDTSIQVAHRFNEMVAQVAAGYQLAFIDEENKPSIRFVYKTEKNATLRLDYKYSMYATDDNPAAPKRKVVVYQRISGELQVITDIYNYLFNANLTPGGVMAAATQGSDISYHGHTYQFIFQPDDYDPGYWVMTFVK